MIRTTKALRGARYADGREGIVGVSRSASAETATVASTGQQELAYGPLPGTNMGLPSGTSMSSISSPGIYMPVLDGFFSESDSPLLNRLCREIYSSDPVCGAAIEMLSTFPFGDFQLSGTVDERELRKYGACIDALRLKTLLPNMSVDYLTVGKFVGTLTWDRGKGYYTACSPQNIDFCTFEPVPVHGIDPIISFNIPPELTNLLRSKRPELKYLLNRLPQSILAAQKSRTGTVVLDPDNLLYIARRTSNADYGGTSMLRRVLPIWLMEKALIRGTLDQVWKRQRAILHITYGDDTVTPSQADFSELVELFKAADTDPVGAVIATHPSVNVNEIRRGDDFLKYPDLYDQFARMKMHGLGISESFLSGDASFSNVQGSISVMMQYFSSYRSMITAKVFYEKLFPGIAIANNFRKRRSSTALASATHETSRGDYPDRIKVSPFTGELIADFSSASDGSPNNLHEVSASDYSMPRVDWHNSLKPDNTQEFQTMLDALSQHGVPIPLRMWAASAGVSLEQIADQQNSDMRIRKHFLPWVKLIAKNVAAVTGGGMDDPDAGGDTEESSSLVRQLQAMLPGEGSTGARLGLLERDFSALEDRSVYEETGGKKNYRLTKKRRQQIEDKMNRRIARAAAEVAARQSAKENADYDARNPSRRKHYTPR